MAASRSAESGCGAMRTRLATVITPSPPMSVPHLDTRIIEGKKSLLFGPYAGFSSRFLKHGSLADLFESIRPGNIVPLLAVARDNIELSEYLIGQVLQSSAHQFATLRQFFPKAARNDWRKLSQGSASRSSSLTNRGAAC
jgi:malate dehydrogenase (quinone)